MRLKAGNGGGNSSILPPSGASTIDHAGKAIHLGDPEFVGTVGEKGIWPRCLEHCGPNMATESGSPSIALRQASPSRSGRSDGDSPHK
jgi:hypothetical protein